MKRYAARHGCRPLVFTLALFGAAHCGTALGEKEGLPAVATSPSGKLWIEASDRDDKSEEWVVSAADSKLRARLGESRDAQPGSFVFSPDDRWIAATYHLGSGMASAELFRQMEGVKFAPAHDKGTIGQSLWQFYDRSTGRKGATDASREDETRGIVDFIAWSPDGARALYAVRAGERGGEGVYHWGAYYNVRGGRWEVSEYLRDYNKRAGRRWSGQFEDDPAYELVSAESVDALPAEAVMQGRLDAVDRELNGAYQKYRDGLPEKSRPSLREGQRQWLAERDHGAKAFGRFGPRDEAARREMQYRTDAEREKLKELRRKLESGE